MTNAEIAREIAGPCEWSNPCDTVTGDGYLCFSEGLVRDCRACADTQEITAALDAKDAERDEYRAMVIKWKTIAANDMLVRVDAEALADRYRVALKWVEEQASRHKRGCTDEPEYLLRDLDMIEKKARTALKGTA